MNKAGKSFILALFLLSIIVGCVLIAIGCLWFIYTVLSPVVATILLGVIVILLLIWRMIYSNYNDNDENVYKIITTFWRK